MSVYNKTNPESIQKMFGSIAKRYDTTNAILSFQLHKIWNSRLVNQILAHPADGPLLDLCCGTGDIGFCYLKKKTSPATVYFVDFCQEMLDYAQSKSKLPFGNHQLHFIHGDAQEIPLPSSSVSKISIAYGIRNVSDPLRCFQECYRVLSPGGILAILELTRPTNPFLKLGHSFYLKRILPILGKLATSNKEAYQYLCNSIHHFVCPSELKQGLLNTGFQNVQITPLHGGISTILTARKL